MRNEPYYRDERVTLYHGDCREVTAWLEADVLVTDPPYGIKAESKLGGYQTKRQVRNAAPIVGDASSVIRDEMLALWPTKPAVVFGSWRIPRPPRTEHRLIWHKLGQPPGPACTSFMLQDEEIYVWGQGFRRTSPPLRSVIVTTEPRQGAHGAAALVGHPTPKPLGLMETLIDRCPPGAIADPFAGSGSTLVAAKALGRQAVGVEIDERYCEIAARRLSQEVLEFEKPA